MSDASKLIYITTEDGRTYTIEEFGELYRHRRELDEKKQEYTKSRTWWRHNVASRDEPNSKAARADYGDGGKWERLICAWLDGEFSKTSIELPCIVAKRNCKRIARRLMLDHWHRVGRFVAAVWKNGNKDHEKTMEEFGICESTYYWRLEKYASILHFSKRC